MNDQPQLLLITTTAQAIRMHLKEAQHGPGRHWIIDANECKPTEEAASVSWAPCTIFLVDENTDLTEEEEDLLDDFQDERITCWVFHNDLQDFPLRPDRPCFYFQEHGEHGSISVFFQKWRNISVPSERQELLQSQLEFYRERALENFRREYLNAYTYHQLKDLGRKFSDPKELNYVEKLLLDRHPELPTLLGKISPDDPAHRLHEFRLELARYLYQKR